MNNIDKHSVLKSDMEVFQLFDKFLKNDSEDNNMLQMMGKIMSDSTFQEGMSKILDKEIDPDLDADIEAILEEEGIKDTLTNNSIMSEMIKVFTKNEPEVESDESSEEETDPERTRLIEKIKTFYDKDKNYFSPIDMKVLSGKSIHKKIIKSIKTNNELRELLEILEMNDAPRKEREDIDKVCDMIRKKTGKTDNNDLFNSFNYEKRKAELLELIKHPQSIKDQYASNIVEEDNNVENSSEKLTNEERELLLNKLDLFLKTKEYKKFALNILKTYDIVEESDMIFILKDFSTEQIKEIYDKVLEKIRENCNNNIRDILLKMPDEIETKDINGINMIEWLYNSIGLSGAFQDERYRNVTPPKTKQEFIEMFDKFN